MRDNAIFGHVVLFGELEPASSAVLDAATDALDLGIGDTIKESLDFRVNRTVDGHAIGIERIFAILLFHILAYFFEEIKARSGHVLFLGEHDRLFNILAVFLVRDIAGIAHGIEHSVTAALGSLRMTVRAIRFGALQHACEHGVFRDRKAIERLAEVVLACRLETVVTASKVNFVHVEFEDFFLRVGLFDADRRHHFLDLTGKRAFRREEEELGELLRQGRCTAELVARDGTFDKRRRNRPNVHAPVLVERTVFGRHHGMDRIQWNRVDGSPFATFHEVFVRNLAILVVNVRHESRIDLLELRKRRQFRRIMNVDGQRSDKRHENRAHENKEPAENLVGKGNLHHAPNFLPNEGTILDDGRA